MRWLAWLVVLGGCDYLFRIDHFEHIDAGSPHADTSGDGTTDGAAVKLCMPMVMIGGQFNGLDGDPDERDDQLEMFFTRGGGGGQAIFHATRTAGTDDYGPPSAVIMGTGLVFSDPGLTQDALHLFYLDNSMGTAGVLETSRVLVTQPFSMLMTMIATPSLPESIAPGVDEKTMYFGLPDGTMYQGVRTSTGADFAWTTDPVGHNIRHPSVTGDGLTVYYDHDSPSAGIYRQHRMSTSSDFGPDEEQVLTAGTAPQISFDGRWLVFDAPTGFGRADCSP